MVYEPYCNGPHNSSKSHNELNDMDTPWKIARHTRSIDCLTMANQGFKACSLVLGPYLHVNDFTENPYRWLVSLIERHGFCDILSQMAKCIRGKSIGTTLSDQHRSNRGHTQSHQGQNSG